MFEAQFYEKMSVGNTTIWEGQLSVLPSVGQRLSGWFHKSGTWIVKEIHWYFGQDKVTVLIRCRRPHFWEFIW